MSFLINCPICGPRQAYEFRFGGEVKEPKATPSEQDPRVWAERVHMSANPAGPQEEWWCHRLGCGGWFTIWRDTRSNRQVPAPEAHP
ncbi:MAG: sarcosine oxidase subunit delta [Thermodesulfobacteriota bacterium]